MLNLNLLLSFYFVTSLGSLLAMISTFIAAEATFGSLGHLAVAMSLRTIVSICASFGAPKVFSRFGFKKVLLVTEIFGIIALGVLAYGSSTGNFFLAALAISLLAVPSNLSSQGVIALVRLNCGEDKAKFTKYSTRISKWLGLSDVAIGLLAPVFLLYVDLQGIYFFDLSSYVLGIGLLLFFKEELDRSSQNRPAVKSLAGIFSVTNFSRLKSLFSTLSLIGLVPIIAGSSEFQELFKSAITSKVHINALWATEGTGFFLAAYIYGKPELKNRLRPLFQLSVVPLILSVVLVDYVLLVSACVWLTISYDVLFKSDRDEALIKAGQNAPEVLLVTSSFSIIKSFYCSISPILIVSLVKVSSATYALSAVLVLQALILSLTFFKKDSLQSDTDLKSEPVL